MARFLYILTLVLSASAYGQLPDLSDYKEDTLSYQYSTKGAYLGDTINSGKLIGVGMMCCFNDSIQFYLNEQFVSADFYHTNGSTSSAGGITLDVSEIDEPTLIILFPIRKEYWKIELDKEYRYMRFNGMWGTKAFGRATFSNYIVELQ